MLIRTPIVVQRFKIVCPPSQYTKRTIRRQSDTYFRLQVDVTIWCGLRYTILDHDYFYTTYDKKNIICIVSFICLLIHMPNVATESLKIVCSSPHPPQPSQDNQWTVLTRDTIVRFPVNVAVVINGTLDHVINARF